MVRAVRSSARLREQFERALMQEIGSSSPGGDSARAFKTAQSYYALGRYRDAVDWLAAAGAGAAQCWLKGKSLRQLKDYEGAVAAFEEAEGKGAGGFETAMAVADCLRRKGDAEFMLPYILPQRHAHVHRDSPVHVPRRCHRTNLPAYQLSPEAVIGRVQQLFRGDRLLPNGHANTSPRVPEPILASCPTSRASEDPNQTLNQKLKAALWAAYSESPKGMR